MPPVSVVRKARGRGRLRRLARRVNVGAALEGVVEEEEEGGRVRRRSAVGSWRSRLTG